MRARDALFVLYGGLLACTAACGGDEGSAEGALSRPANAKAFASLAPLDGSGVRAAFEFRASSKTLVELTIKLSHCHPDTLYLTSLNTGTGCDSQKAQGVEWVAGKGDQLPPLTCGADSTAERLYRQGPLDKFVWTFDDNAETTVLGRVALVVEPSPKLNTPSALIACGVVE